MTLSKMPTTKNLMLHEGGIPPMNNSWVVRGAWAQMNSNTVMQRGETVEELGDYEPCTSRCFRLGG